MSDKSITKQQARKAYDGLKYPGDLVADITYRHAKLPKRKWPRRLAIAAVMTLGLFVGLAILSRPQQNPFNISSHMNVSLQGGMSLPTSLPSMSLPTLPNGMSLSPQVPGHLPMVGSMPSTLNDASESDQHQTTNKELAI
ncbi:MAG: hypothetical protein ACF8OB_08930 [Phycisphaeraceae bacterium JB051]